MSGVPVSDMTIDGTSIFDRQEFAVTTDVLKALFSRPSPRENSQTRPDASGVFELTRYYGDRVFTLPGRVRAQAGGMTPFLSAHDLLGQLLATGIDHVLIVTFSDGSQRQLSFRVTGAYDFDGVGNYTAGRFTVDCRAADPRWYGTVTRSGTFTAGSSVSGGFSFPLVFPLDFTGQGANVLTILNAGNFITDPVYTLTGPWVNPFLQNQTNGAAFYLTTLNLLSTDTLIVDTHQHSVTLNGTLRNDLVDWSASSNDAASSNWPVFSAGANQIVAGGAYQTGATLTVTANDAWI